MPELRKDPVTGRWVIIATDRAKRPTDFVRDKVQIRGSGFCPFCYGNESKTPPEILAYRSDGSSRNAPGWSLRVVANKFPALGIEGSLNRQGEGLYDKMNGIGAHEVIIETPKHELTLATLPVRQVEDVLWAYRDRIIDLKKDRRFKYILIFKNHGDAAGASLEHTHSQLIALPVVPKRVTEEVEGAREHYNFKERCIFCDIIRQETESKIRLISENDGFLAMAPFASDSRLKCGSFPRRTSAPSRNLKSASLNSSLLCSRICSRAWTVCWIFPHIIKLFTLHRLAKLRKTIITGISRSYPSSPRWRDLSGARASISIPPRRKSRQNSCATPQGPSGFSEKQAREVSNHNRRNGTKPLSPFHEHGPQSGMLFRLQGRRTTVALCLSRASRARLSMR